MVNVMDIINDELHIAHSFVCLHPPPLTQQMVQCGHQCTNRGMRQDVATVVLGGDSGRGLQGMYHERLAAELDKYVLDLLIYMSWGDSDVATCRSTV